MRKPCRWWNRLTTSVSGHSWYLYNTHYNKSEMLFRTDTDMCQFCGWSRKVYYYRHPNRIDFGKPYWDTDTWGDNVTG